MLRAKDDRYTGVIIEGDSIEVSHEAFKISLQSLKSEAKKEEKRLIWLDLTTNQAQHIAVALELGFIFHNCEPHRTTLICRLKADAYVPVSPSHTIGVGAVVINEKNEILMVRDRVHNNHSIYKLPGGMLEHADKLADGVEREVWEETGIKATVTKMVSLLNAHPYRFNKSNMYIVFQMEASTHEINVIDTHEIELALWLPLDEFFAHKEMSAFQKDLVKQTLECEGLTLLDNHDRYFKGKQHVEVYG